MRAVNAPFGEGPNPIAAVSHKLARVQFNESIPWLSPRSVFDRSQSASLGHTRRALPARWIVPFAVLACHQRYPWSNTCLPERRQHWFLEFHFSPYPLTSIIRTQSYNTAMADPRALIQHPRQIKPCALGLKKNVTLPVRLSQA